MTAVFINRVEPYFIGVGKDTGEVRWFELPDQLAKIVDGYPNFFFSAEITDEIFNPLQMQVVEVPTATLTTLQANINGNVVLQFLQTPKWVAAFAIEKIELTVVSFIFNIVTSQTEVVFICPIGMTGTIKPGTWLFPSPLFPIRFKLPTPCDAVNIIFDQARGRVQKHIIKSIMSDNGTNVITIPSFSYIPHTKNIKVFVNGNLYGPDLYTEVDTKTVNVFLTPIINLEIVSVDTIHNAFVVSGNVADRFLNGLTFTVSGSTPLSVIDGTYTVVSSSFNSTTGQTTIFVTTNITATPIINGVINDLEAVFVVLLTPGVLRSDTELDEFEYRRINSTIIELAAGVEYSDLGQITIQMLNPAVGAHTPLKLIDFRADVVKAVIPLWDPARGHHYEQSLQVVDIQDPRDPGIYEITLDGISHEIRDISATDPQNALRKWTTPEVGTIWWDTRNLHYVPYFDDIVFPDEQRRNSMWGTLADWSSTRLYEWIESPVLPEEWDQYVTEQAKNKQLTGTQKPSGTPRRIVYKRTRSGLTQGFQDLSLGTPLALASDTGLTSSTDYTFDIRINDGGTVETIVITTQNIPPITVGDLLSLLNNTLDGATASLTSLGDIRISSDITGDTSAIRITKSQTYLFQNVIIQPQNFGTATTSGFQDITYPTNFTLSTDTGLPNNEVFTFNIDINDAGVEQHIQILTPGTGVVTFSTFKQLLNDAMSGAHALTTLDDPLIPQNVLRFKSNALGSSSTVQLSTSPIFLLDELGVNISITQDGITNGPWSAFVKERDSLVLFYDPLLSPSFTNFDVTPLNIDPGTEVNVHVNGIFRQTAVVTSTQEIILSTPLNPIDRVAIQHLAHEPTLDELAFDPDILDDPEILVHYKLFTNYSTLTTINSDEQTRTTKYYFWIQDKTTKIDDHTLSLINAQLFLKKPPSPYFYLLHFLQQVETVNSDGQYVFVPDRFSKVVAQGLSGIVTDDNRYKIRFPRDLTLRDRLRDTPIDVKGTLHEPKGTLKNVHTEWQLIREKQTATIPRKLWNSITEAIIGHKLNSSTILVPTTDRILYDAEFGTDTQFGSKDNQSFTNANKALATIEAILKSPDLDLDPLDKDTFFNIVFNTTTDQGIINMMDFIYNSFSSTNVNRMFFSVLQDAFSTKKEFQDIFKTSWISLESTAQLNVNGKFDNG